MTKQSIKILMLLASMPITTTHAYVSSLTPSTIPMPSLPKVTTSNEKKDETSAFNDTTEIGTLKVPSVGTGTISWSSNECKYNIRV